MKVIRYIMDCFFSKPSAYQLRRSRKNPNMYMIFNEGKRIHEGDYKACQEFIHGKRLEVSPSLYE